MTKLLAGALVVALLSSPALAGGPVERLGSGADEVWILRPTARATSVVVFGHGWSTPLPSGFGAWVDHLRSRGSIVIYPRYRVSAADSTTSALTAFRAGIVTAFRRLGTVRVPVVAVGKSFGGSAVFDYATQAPSWRVPAPVAVLSIFPALPIDGLPSRPLPARTYVELMVGDRDTTAGSAGADAYWRWLSPHRGDRKRYVVVHSRPGFVANHDAPQRTDAITRSVFWKPLDALIARAPA